MNEESYSSETSFPADRHSGRKTTTKTKVPSLRIFKLTKKRIPATDFGQIMGSLTLGMLFVFPALASLTMALPKEVFCIILLLSLGLWVYTQRWIAAIICFAFCAGMIILGFVSIGILMLIIG